MKTFPSLTKWLTKREFQNFCAYTEDYDSYARQLQISCPFYTQEGMEAYTSELENYFPREKHKQYKKAAKVRRFLYLAIVGFGGLLMFSALPQFSFGWGVGLAVILWYPFSLVLFRLTKGSLPFVPYLTEEERMRKAYPKMEWRQITPFTLGDVAKLMRRATSARSSRNYKLEKELIEKIINSEPTLAESWLNLGRACSDLGELGEAIIAFRRALILKPRYVKALYNLGNIYLADRYDFNKAKSYFQYALACDPSPSEALAIYRGLGDLYFFHRLDFKKAASAYRKAQSIDPGNTEVVLKLRNMQDKEFQAMLISHFGESKHCTPQEVREYLNPGTTLAKTKKERERLNEKRAEIDALLSD